MLLPYVSAAFLSVTSNFAEYFDYKLSTYTSSVATTTTYQLQ